MRVLLVLLIAGVLAALLLIILHQKSRRRVLEAEIALLAPRAERLRILLETIGEWVWEVDSLGRYTYVGPEVLDLIGWQPAELLGRKPAEFMNGGASATRLFEELIAAGDPIVGWEGDWRHRDGRIVTLELSGRPFFGSDRRLLGYRGVARDATGDRRRQAEERLRRRVYELLSSEGDFKKVLTLIIDHVETARPNLICAIHAVDESRQRLTLAAAPSLPDFFVEALRDLAMDVGGNSIGRVAATGDAAMTEDIGKDEGWAAHRQLAKQAGLGSSWAEPIRDSRGSTIGVFVAFQRQVGELGEEDLAVSHKAVELARTPIQREREEAEHQLATSVFKASGQAIVITDAQNRIVAVNPAFSRLTGYRPADAIGHNPRFLSSGRTPRHAYVEMWSSLGELGQWQGEIWNRRKDGKEYVEWLTVNAVKDANGEVHQYVGMFSDVTEKKKAEEALWRRGNYDFLTDLPNRRLFLDRLQQEIKRTKRTDHKLAVLLIDIDRFREINDSLGHETGDLLLVEVARRIASHVRDSDTVARLGNDEFAVVVPGLPDLNRAEAATQSIIEALRQPFQLKERTIHASASIGTTIYPDDSSAAEELVKNAEQAMYAAKDQGHDRFCFFTESMQQAALRRARLSSDLHDALAARQLEVLYQPIFDLASGHAVGAEALLRWNHPVLGTINPADFIPLAEQTGLINELGDFVFRTAAREAARWQSMAEHRTGKKWKAEDGPPPYRISINMSPRQFYTDAAADVWFKSLAEIGLPSQCVVIEITEGLLLENHPVVSAKLSQFRERGFRIALDDFGTGYSAMSYLKKFHLDYLKIDKSFVRDMVSDADDRAIVEAIVIMAHKLGLQIIAEGIEQESQKSLLMMAGCDFGQGYLFAKPMTAADLAILLAPTCASLATIQATV